MPALTVDRCYRYAGYGHLVWSPTLGDMDGTEGVKLDGLVLDLAISRSRGRPRRWSDPISKIGDDLTVLNTANNRGSLVQSVIAMAFLFGYDNYGKS